MACAGHDELVVEGRHEQRAALARDLLGQVVAALASPVVEDDLGAVAARRVDLRLRARPSGMTIVARMPRSFETSATACAWLPEENATTASTVPRSLSALILL